MFYTFREPNFVTFSVIFSQIATFSHIAAFSHLRLPHTITKCDTFRQFLPEYGFLYWDTTTKRYHLLHYGHTRHWHWKMVAFSMKRSDIFRHFSYRLVRFIVDNSKVTCILNTLSVASNKSICYRVVYWREMNSDKALAKQIEQGTPIVPFPSTRLISPDNMDNALTRPLIHNNWVAGLIYIYLDIWCIIFI